MNMRTTLSLVAALTLAGYAAAQPANAPARGAPAPITAVVPPAAELPANTQTVTRTPAAMPVTASVPTAFLIRGGTVHTMGSQGVLQGADVLINGGKIAAVCLGLTPPQGAEVIEAHGRPVTPGLMAS